MIIAHLLYNSRCLFEKDCCYHSFVTSTSNLSDNNSYIAKPLSRCPIVSEIPSVRTVVNILSYDMVRAKIRTLDLPDNWLCCELFCTFIGEQFRLWLLQN